MRRKRTGAILATCAAAALLCGEARAQNREKAWEISPYGGFVSFGTPKLGDGTTVTTFRDPMTMMVTSVETVVVKSDIDNSPSFGFRFGYHHTRNQMIEFGFGGAATEAQFTRRETVVDGMNMPISNSFAGDKVSVDILVGQVNYIYNFFLQRRGRVVGFASGGVGLINYSVFGTSPQSDLVVILEDIVGDTNNFIYNYGAGIRFFGGPKAGVRLDARRYHYDAGSRSGLHHFEVTLGLTLVLGGA